MASKLGRVGDRFKPAGAGFRIAVAFALIIALASFARVESQAPSDQQSNPEIHYSGKPAPPDSAYAGDAACASCHQKEAHTYFATPHYLDSTVASAKTILGDFTPGKDILHTANPDLVYAMVSTPDGFYQSAVDLRDPQHLLGEPERQRFDIVVGSGRHGQTYLYWKGDELYELPVSWWAYTRQWINSPGYIDGQIHFNRRVGPRCLECHITRFDSTPPPSNRYIKDSLVLGIGCERCHGPGREHVDREKSANPPAVGSPQIAIVNPSRLARDRQLDLCSLCHAGGGNPIAPALAYQVGDNLAKFLKITEPSANTPVDVHGNQVGALEASKCFTSGKMTCSTCHDVHKTQETAADFSVHCLQCHTIHSCPRFKQLGESIRTRCVSCHMPVGKSKAVTTASHGTTMQAEMRTHRIAIYPAASGK